MTAQRDTMVRETAARLFADAATGSQAASGLWTAVRDLGLDRAWVPEAHGGAGGDVLDGFDVIQVAGQYAVDVPLVETLIAGRLMALAGLSLPDEAVSLAPVRVATLDGAAGADLRAVPFARECASLIVHVGGDIYQRVAASCLLSRDRGNDTGARRVDAALRSGSLQAIERFDLERFDLASPVPGVSRLALEGAVARSVQMAGALEAVLKISVDYAEEREAFGRKIGRFQAVQQMLARLAGEVAAALTASGSAAEAIASGLDDADGLLLEVASAKVRVAEAAETAATIAHQVHGAIGVTQEYRLQRHTRALIGWREDFGAPALWAERLGHAVAARGGHGLWPYLTTR